MNLTLGKRIASGIILMMILMVAVGLVGYVGLTRVLNVTEFSRKVNELDLAIYSARSNVDRYLLSIYSDNKELRDVSLKAVSDGLAKGLAILGEIKSDSASVGVDQKALENSTKEIDGFSKAFEQYGTLANEKTNIEGSIDQLFTAMFENIGKGVIRTDQMLVAGNVLKASFINYVKRPVESSWSTVENNLDSFGKIYKEWSDLVSSSTQLTEVSQTINKLHQEITGATARFHAISIMQDDLMKAMDGNNKSLSNICSQLVEQSVKNMQSQTRTSIRLIFGFIVLALVIGIIYSTISIRSIVGKLKSVIEGVAEGSRQVATASSLVSVSSQKLAEGASQQAAAVEETSSSLEEMASMTKQNANNSSQANQLMVEANTIVGRANESMSQVTSSMNEISQASESTQKIVKTIDEISFQTNLLALNAAVEAARAGEAGAGFAVVADEVRNLAMRAAEAAKNTASLIEGTVRKIKEGSELVVRTNGEFKQLTSTVEKFGGLIGEIAAASNEQAQGIEHINQAVSEVDKVTQQNSASAEESASAAEEMQAQAEQMMDYIKSLGALVGGNSNGRAEKSTPAGSIGKDNVQIVASVSPSGKTLALSGKEKKSVELSSPRRISKEVKPEQVIPFEDDNFTDF